MMQVLHSKASMVDHWRCHGIIPRMSRWSNFGEWLLRWIKNDSKKTFLTHKSKGSLAKDTQEMEVWLWDGSDDFCWPFFLIGKLFFQGVNLEPRSFHGWEFTCPMCNCQSTVAAMRTTKTSCWQFQLSMIPPDPVFWNIYLQYVWERLTSSNHCIVARKDCKWNPSKSASKRHVPPDFCSLLFLKYLVFSYHDLKR